MLNLSLHGDAEERDEVHDQDWPEHRDVEELKEGADEGDHCGLGGRVPELELRQATNERPKFVRLTSRKLHAIISLLFFELGHGRIDFRG